MIAPLPTSPDGQHRIDVHLTSLVLGIAARSVQTGMTSRPAAVVLWSSVGKPFTIQGGTGESVWTGNAAIIAPNFVRTLAADDCHIISVNFEPNHPAIAALAGMVGSSGILPIDHRHVRAFSGDLHGAIDNRESSYIDAVSMELAHWLSPQAASRREMDHRARAVLARLEDDLNAAPTVTDLAHQFGLSANRLSHLLAKELGMPYRSYLLWRKYRKALGLLHEPQNLAWVAHAAGFYDQAHMTRTFMNYFGYSPASIRARGLILSHR